MNGHGRILGVAQCINRLRQDLRVGQQSLAHDLGAEDRRRREKEEDRRQPRSDDSAGEGRAESALPRPRRCRVIHSLKSF